MPRNNDNALSLHERLATAVVSMVASACTLLVLPLLISVVGNSGEPLVLYAMVFSKTGGAIIASFGAAGFILGSEKMAGVFGFFWGTHPLWEETWFQKCVAALVIVIAVGAAGHLILSR